MLLKPNAKVYLNKTGLFESNFFYGSGNQFDHPTPHISRRTNLRSIQLYSIVKQPIYCRLKVKKKMMTSVIC